jgi:16S rRNA (guanine527-N7)-methyltransferase
MFGLELSNHQADQFSTYEAALLDWNTRINLTAITQPDDIRVRHFLDSLSLVTVVNFDEGDRLIDVGTGAGFPGMALAIAFPHLQVTLMDATAKKLAFAEHLIARLGLRNVRTLHSRAEEAGQRVQQRAQFDVVTARAVARLPILLEYMLPLAKVNGLCIAMKGPTAEAEIGDSRKAAAILGGEIQPPAQVVLPGVEDPHYLVTTIKVKSTPRAYPRKAGIPTKSPLGADSMS